MTGSAFVFPDWLASRAAGIPDHPALVVGEKTWTFASLDADVSELSATLATLGVRHGDRVATLLHNGVHAALLPHAVLRLGATLVPLNVRLSDVELEWQIRDASPRILIGDGRSLSGLTKSKTALSGLSIVDVDEGALRAAASPVSGREPPLRLEHDGDSVLAIIYTSGTTGHPKAAMLTVSNFWWSAIGSALNLGLAVDDRWLACLPLFHVGGLSILLRCVIYGIAAEVHEGFDAGEVNAAIDDRGVTIVSVVAVMLQKMLDERGERPFPKALRCVLLGGGPAPLSLLERCAAMGAPVVQTYGLTETCSQVATLALADVTRKLGSAGKALYPNELRIASSSAAGQAPDEVGEILVRGPVVMAGYAGNSEATSRAMADGWLHTGDIGRLDDEGYLYVLDRRDDLIVSGGENVYPAEVEAALLSHLSVAEAAVIGVHDEKWGQKVVAVVRLAHTADDQDAQRLDSHCRSRLAGYKVPREFKFVDEPLPRTASGKLRRSALRGESGGASER